MTDLKKRIFEWTGRVLGFVASNPDLFTKPAGRKNTPPRKPSTNTKTTKR